ncbi:thiosulfate transporter TsuA-like [Oscarella lobularis]|uniref:thiosulfate transporter TsuA-like n=1 Tax=Oscarella lobularis TaxID=121494 RepID=UPI0033139174
MTNRRLRARDLIPTSPMALEKSSNGSATTADSPCETSTKSKLTWSAAGAAISAGLIFGWFVQKSNVYIPDVIFRQMKMEQFTMMKIFLSATATGQIWLTLVSLLKRNRYDEAVNAFTTCPSKGFLSISLGAIILGSGMAVCGACPGTVTVQIGTGLHYAGVVLAGGFVGVLLYIILEPFLSYKLDPIGRLGKQKQNLTTWFDVPVWKLAFPISLCLIAIVVVLEIFLPYKHDYPYPQSYCKSTSNCTTSEYVQTIRVLSDPTWPPYVSGIAVGSIQLIIVAAMKDTMGSSTGWTSLIAGLIYVTIPKIARKSTYIMNSKDGLANVWQIFFYMGAIVAAAFAALSSNLLINPSPPIESFNPVRSFFGGVMILFGSRLASGCTSGHGISGLALLNTMSFVAVPFMFVGGIFTAFAMDGFHYHGNYFSVPN